MKILIGIGALAVVLMAGGVWMSNNTTPGSEDTSDLVSQNGLHWHPQIEIYIKGEQVEIPENIGLIGGHRPIHTHNDVPDIHLEFEGRVAKDDIRLGEFFRIWGKIFNAQQLFEYKNGPEGTVSMSVNGVENFEFEKYLMQDGDTIEIRYE